jgi:hypothetical protein
MPTCSTSNALRGLLSHARLQRSYSSAGTFSNARTEFKRMFEAEARNFEQISSVITDI